MYFERLPMSSKTAIIEEIFDARWNDSSSQVADPLVSLLDVQQAIERHNINNPSRRMSTRNPANFFKDFVRNQKRANHNWPSRVFARGYTARQITSSGYCFEFIRITANQIEPFPLNTLPLPDDSTPVVQIESVSLPLASKRLGRKDEPWLIQVLVKLRVFETHLALTSRQRIIQLDHLQTNIKLSGSEIDALFLGVQQGKDEQVSEAIVCCEAKGRRDDILPQQILNQVRAAYAMGIEQNLVIPLAVKAIAPSRVWVVEFEPVERAALPQTTSLTVATSAIYQLRPSVKGIGE